MIFTVLCLRFPPVGGALGGLEPGAENQTEYARVLGAVTLIPAVVTVVLAFATKEILFSLFSGVLSGMIILEGAGGTGALLPRAANIFRALFAQILETSSDSFKMAIVILCLAVGGMVKVIHTAGGFSALGNRVVRGVRTARGTQLAAGLLGVLVFFDDYASALITGPVMRSAADRKGVSRAKLAFIVDSTAAPVSGIAVISSWLAAQLDAIGTGFSAAGVQASAYEYFVASLPYCFYNVLAVAFVFATALLGREYGPMLAAEKKARQEAAAAPVSGEPAPPEKADGWMLWTALVPILAFILCSCAGIWLNGSAAAAAAGELRGGRFSLGMLTVVLSYADAVTVLLRASLLASLTAILMARLGGRSLTDSVSDWISGASEILPTVVMLILAWSLSAVLGRLGTANYLVDSVSGGLPAVLMPMVIFLVCCVISFATGSFGCMVVVMPIAVPLSLHAASAFPGFVPACIAAVLSGSVFGDHSSPVTDTTILSSLGADCPNFTHVETQLPYALTAAAISAVLGCLLSGFGVTPAVTLPLCVAAVFGFVRLAGQKTI